MMMAMAVEDAAGFLQSLKQVAALDFDRLLSGHGHTPYYRRDGDTKLALHDLWYQCMKRGGVAVGGAAAE